MAVTYGDYGKPVSFTASECWWLNEQGKMCLSPMVSMFHELSYQCVHGHKTTHKEVLERKRK